MFVRVYIKTYGCVLNQVDSEVMRRSLIEKGHDIVDREEDADVIVVNTCAVKKATEKKELFYIDKLREKGKKFVIAGCLTSSPQLLEHYKVPMVAASCPSFVADAVEDVVKGRHTFYLLNERKPPVVFISGVIAKFALQEGCTNICTYCQTKLARKGPKSRRPLEVYRALDYALLKGVKEIQFSGTDLGAYGLDIGLGLSDLVKTLYFKYKDKGFKIRIGMANPHHVKREIEIVKYLDGAFFSFLHVPVQSGSDSVLHHMKRGYVVDDFMFIVNKARDKYGDAFTLATDVIVGYPTESEEDFELSLKLIERAKPNVVHVSKFSPRPNTYAAKLKQLDDEVVLKRSKQMSELVREISMKENEKWIGKEVWVVSTEEGKGRTSFYRQAVFLDPPELGWEGYCTVVGITDTSLLVERL